MLRLRFLPSQFLKDVLNKITTFEVAGGLKNKLKSLHGYADMVCRPFLSVGRKSERRLEAAGSSARSPRGMHTPPSGTKSMAALKSINLLLAELHRQMFWQTAEG